MYTICYIRYISITFKNNEKDGSVYRTTYEMANKEVEDEKILEFVFDMPI